MSVGVLCRMAVEAGRAQVRRSADFAEPAHLGVGKDSLKSQSSLFSPLPPHHAQREAFLSPEEPADNQIPL